MPSRKQNDTNYITVPVQLPEQWFDLIQCLNPKATVEHIILDILDHVQQGVYRPGAWEREWLLQATVDDWVDNLEPGDPYGRPDCDDIFVRPKIQTIRE